MFQVASNQLHEMDDSQHGVVKQSIRDDLEKFAPELAATAGDDGMDRLVDLGFERSASYGLTLIGPVRFYLELMMALGSGFDTDRQLPWAGAILSDPAIADEMIRAKRLHRAMRHYALRVSGEDNQARVAALGRAGSVLDRLHEAPEAFEPWLQSMLHTAYPEKADYILDVGFNAMFRKARLEAQRLRVDTPFGHSLLASLMFAFGHDVASDPLYQWVAASLDDDTDADPDERARRTRAKVTTYLNAVAENYAEKAS